MYWNWPGKPRATDSAKRPQAIVIESFSAVWAVFFSVFAGKAHRKMTLEIPLQLPFVVASVQFLYCEPSPFPESCPGVK
jgi:hypothetical protein